MKCCLSFSHVADSPSAVYLSHVADSAYVGDVRWNKLHSILIEMRDACCRQSKCCLSFSHVADNGGDGDARWDKLHSILVEMRDAEDLPVDTHALPSDQEYLRHTNILQVSSLS